MKIAGIIAEYNPFHNGHLYQAQKTKKDLNADCIIAVMSGNFVMRGEPALYNKFVRAKAATCSGVDLVLELSVPYALSSAEYFALGGVRLLESLNIVDYLSFGSEAGDIKPLDLIAIKLSDEGLIENIKDNQKKGIPYFSAVSEEFDDKEKEILKCPNNILGINYLKALKKINSKIIPYTVPRIMTGYNDTAANGSFASATALREMLCNNEDISALVPPAVCELIKDIPPAFEEEFDKTLSYVLTVKSGKELLKYPDVSEGLENLIKEAGQKCFGVKETAQYIKSKRYTYTRIKRILFNILLDIDKTQREKAPEFARVLAFNEKGRELISILNKKSGIPVFTNITKDMYSKYEMLNTDLKATEIYSIICRNKGGNHKRILL